MYGFIYRVDSSHVVHHCTYLNRECTRRYLATYASIDKLLLTTLRVFEFQRFHLNAECFGRQLAHVVDGVGFVLLNTYNCAIDAQRLHQDLDTYNDFLSVFQHQLVVASEIGFALYAIDNQHFCFLTRRRKQFYLCGEACASESHDTGSSHFIHNLFGFKRAVAFDSRSAVDGFEPFVALYIHEDSRHAQSPCIGGSVNFCDSTAERRVYVGTDKSACLCNEFAYFYLLSFFHHRLRRCPDMLHERNNRFSGQRTFGNRLVCRINLVVMWMYSTYSERIHAFVSSCLGSTTGAGAGSALGAAGSAGLRGGKLIAWIAPVGHSASHLRHRRHLV